MIGPFINALPRNDTNCLAFLSLRNRHAWRASGVLNFENISKLLKSNHFNIVLIYKWNIVVHD